MRALIIGGTGFIGSHLADKLLLKGDAIKILARNPEKYRTELNNIQYIYGDFRDTGLLQESLKEIDIIYHLASTTVPATANQDPVKDIEDNLIGSINLFNIMLKNEIPKIIFLSSGGTVYGNPKKIPIPETHSLCPISSYGIVKTAIENYLLMYAKQGLEYTILRPSNPYGPRQSPTGTQGLITTVLSKMINNDPITVWGDGSAVRDYIYIDDLSDIISIAGHSRVQGIYNAGSGTGYSINEIISYATEITGIKPNIEYKEKRSFDVKEVVLDIDKAQQDFGWLPTTNINNGMKKHWKWIINEYDIIK